MGGWGNRIWKPFQSSKTSLWQNGHTILKNAENAQIWRFLVISGSSVLTVAILGRKCWLIWQEKIPGPGVVIFGMIWGLIP